MFRTFLSYVCSFSQEQILTKIKERDKKKKKRKRASQKLSVIVTSVNVFLEQHFWFVSKWRRGSSNSEIGFVTDSVHGPSMILNG